MPRLDGRGGDRGRLFKEIADARPMSTSPALRIYAMRATLLYVSRQPATSAAARIGLMSGLSVSAEISLDYRLVGMPARFRLIADAHAFFSHLTGRAGVYRRAARASPPGQSTADIYLACFAFAIATTFFGRSSDSAMQ